MDSRVYLAIDLKSFYASVECVDRGLDPLNNHLVVADESRTEKTICLAVTPSLKACGVPGRPRLFEVIERVRALNRERLGRAPGRRFRGKSYFAPELLNDPSLELDYIVAAPRMTRYMEVSRQVYQVYLRYLAPEDIHVYSVDEVFMDVTAYLALYRRTPRELAGEMIRAVLNETGITATAGIGSNLYLCKVAMDIVAKKLPADENGVRIAELDELSYRHLLWDHRPLTDFWRIGRGYARKLAEHGLYTMGDIARCSLGGAGEYQNEDMLYRLFGINAELLIDHAWGYEPCTLAEIRAYKPVSQSLSSGQVLMQPYTAEKARLVLREMADQLAFDLAEKQLLASRFVLSIGYEALGRDCRSFSGRVVRDIYGRILPCPSHGTENLPEHTSSGREITEALTELYDRIVCPELMIRRLNVAAENVLREDAPQAKGKFIQLELFPEKDAEKQQARRREEEASCQRAMRKIRQKYGKNAIFKGRDLMEGATAILRNGQVGGHRA